MAAALAAGMIVLGLAQVAPTATEARTAAPPDSTVVVLMETQLGEIEIAIEAERAPVTAANFLAYVQLPALPL